MCLVISRILIRTRVLYIGTIKCTPARDRTARNARIASRAMHTALRAMRAPHCAQCAQQTCFDRFPGPIRKFSFSGHFEIFEPLGGGGRIKICEKDPEKRVFQGGGGLTLRGARVWVGV